MAYPVGLPRLRLMARDMITGQYTDSTPGGIAPTGLEKIIQMTNTRKNVPIISHKMLAG